MKEGDLASADTNAFVQQVRDYARTHLNCEAAVISAQIEADLVAAGMTVNTPDLAPFKEATAGVYDTLGYGELRDTLQAIAAE